MSFDMRRLSNDLEEAMVFKHALAHEDYISKI